MQLSRWGSRLAIRVPASVVEALKLAEGDDTALHVLGECDFAIGRMAAGLPRQAARGFQVRAR